MASSPAHRSPGALSRRHHGQQAGRSGVRMAVAKQPLERQPAAGVSWLRAQPVGLLSQGAYCGDSGCVLNPWASFRRVMGAAGQLASSLAWHAPWLSLSLIHI
eukprot:5755206-Alexandrium_andersonii.AAC.1